jgi:Fe-S cluster biogenesis protein NfuA
MGLFQTIANVLGLQRPLRVREAGPLSLSKAAASALGGLNEGVYLSLSTMPDGDLFRVVITPSGGGPSGHTPHERLLISEDDGKRVIGLELDYQDDRWRISLQLRVLGLETPNPNSRRYQTDRVLHQGQPAYFIHGHLAPPLAAPLLAHEAVVSVLFRHNEITIERVEGIDWATLDADIDALLRDAMLHCAPMVESADELKFEGELERGVWSVLQQEVLPAIHRDGGDLQLLGIEDGVVKVALNGACASCPASTLTLKGGVERVLLKAFPDEIVGVEAI